MARDQGGPAGAAGLPDLMVEGSGAASAMLTTEQPDQGGTQPASDSSAAGGVAGDAMWQLPAHRAVLQGAAGVLCCRYVGLQVLLSGQQM